MAEVARNFSANAFNNNVSLCLTSLTTIIDYATRFKSVHKRASDASKQIASCCGADFTAKLLEPYDASAEQVKAMFDHMTLIGCGRGEAYEQLAAARKTVRQHIKALHTVWYGLAEWRADSKHPSGMSFLVEFVKEAPVLIEEVKSYKKMMQELRKTLTQHMKSKEFTAACKTPEVTALLPAWEEANRLRQGDRALPKKKKVIELGETISSDDEEDDDDDEEDDDDSLIDDGSETEDDDCEVEESVDFDGDSQDEDANQNVLEKLDEEAKEEEREIRARIAAEEAERLRANDQEITDDIITEAPQPRRALRPRSAEQIERMRAWDAHLVDEHVTYFKKRGKPIAPVDESDESSEFDPTKHLVDEDDIEQQDTTRLVVTSKGRLAVRDIEEKARDTAVYQKLGSSGGDEEDDDEEAEDATSDDDDQHDEDDDVDDKQPQTPVQTKKRQLVAPGAPKKGEQRPAKRMAMFSPVIATPPANVPHANGNGVANDDDEEIDY